jgi:hypothetical protein
VPLSFSCNCRRFCAFRFASGQFLMIPHNLCCNFRSWDTPCVSMHDGAPNTLPFWKLQYAQMGEGREPIDACLRMGWPA